jgi:hypothetical protein
MSQLLSHSYGDTMFAQLQLPDLTDGGYTGRSHANCVTTRCPNSPYRVTFDTVEGFEGMYMSVYPSQATNQQDSAKQSARSIGLHTACANEQFTYLPLEIRSTQDDNATALYELTKRGRVFRGRHVSA